MDPCQMSAATYLDNTLTDSVNLILAVGGNLSCNADTRDKEDS